MILGIALRSDSTRLLSQLLPKVPITQLELLSIYLELAVSRSSDADRVLAFLLNISATLRALGATLISICFSSQRKLLSISEIAGVLSMFPAFRWW